MPLQHVEPMVSNADLYHLTPPAYTQSMADGEVSIDAEAVRQEKARVPEPSSHPSSPVGHQLQQQPSHASSSRNGPAPAEPQIEHAALVPQLSPHVPSNTPVFGHYLTEPVTTADLVGTRACSILHDRPAIWLVRRKKMALSPLAAAVLTKEGLIRVKDLELSVLPSARANAYSLLQNFPILGWPT